MENNFIYNKENPDVIINLNYVFFVGKHTDRKHKEYKIIFKYAKEERSWRFKSEEDRNKVFNEIIQKFATIINV